MGDGHGRYFEKYQIWCHNDIRNRFLCRFYVGLKSNIVCIWQKLKFENFPTVKEGVVATSKSVRFEASNTSGIDFSVDFTSVQCLTLSISDKMKIRKISHGQWGRGRYRKKYPIWGLNNVSNRFLGRFYVGRGRLSVLHHMWILPRTIFDTVTIYRTPGNRF